MNKPQSCVASVKFSDIIIIEPQNIAHELLTANIPQQDLQEAVSRQLQTRLQRR